MVILMMGGLDNMKFRKDITEYISKQLGKDYKSKVFKVYEQDGLLYMANYNYDNKNKIESFSNYSLLWGDANHLNKEIEDVFNVKFALKGCDLICKCGESKNFSGYYGHYRMLLRCNSCDNNFSVYSG